MSVTRVLDVLGIVSTIGGSIAGSLAGEPRSTVDIDVVAALDVGGGRVIHVHPPEDILLQKLHWYRKGREVSDRQWRDILGIVRVQGDRLDLGYVERYAPVLVVADLLARALHDADT